MVIQTTSMNWALPIVWNTIPTSLVIFLRYSLVYSKLALNSLCSLRWSWISDLPASSQMLRLQACTTMSSLQSSGDGSWVLKCVSQGLCSLSSISSQGALFLSCSVLQGKHHHPQNMTPIKRVETVQEKKKSIFQVETCPRDISVAMNSGQKGRRRLLLYNSMRSHRWKEVKAGTHGSKSHYTHHQDQRNKCILASVSYPASFSLSHTVQEFGAKEWYSTQ